MGWGVLIGTLSMWPSRKEQFGLQAPGISIWVAVAEQHFQAWSRVQACAAGWPSSAGSAGLLPVAGVVASFAPEIPSL